MAEQQTEFAYHNIQLDKLESLGSGSYGRVCKAKCDGRPCAAKIMHSTLFDLQDLKAASYLSRFQGECDLLSKFEHPNIVQYLATYYDPDTQLPVLLMELCDESLTAFLERSPGPLSYHVQLNICLDIALALVYLHSNGVIHRDLTGNNVLMIAGTRAKITDFGMSKLATGNPRMTALTLCPGNEKYMSPEAIDKPVSYTAKLDIFSFGVIVIQILTRQFPNPTDRLRTVHVPQLSGKEVREIVPETERRQAHLQLIPDTHSLKPLALQCLKKEMQRPSALQLSESLSELKEAPQYTESVHQAQTRGGNETTVTTNETNTVSAAQNDEMTWKKGKKAPEKMTRGAAVVHGNTAYFSPFDSVRVYSYQNISGIEEWSRLPDNPSHNFSLAVIDGFPTSLGGHTQRSPTDYVVTNTLLSLKGEGEKKKWSEVFPPMPTPRSLTACITTKKALIVAGGTAGGDMDIVEVMDINTKQWTTVCPLPQPLWSLSGIVCGDSLYLAGGISGYSESKSVFTCSLPDLWQPKTFGSRLRQTFFGSNTKSNVWKEISSLPVIWSTLASFDGHLLAIGGKDDSRNPTTDVYRYDSHTDSWHAISQMKNKRSQCLAVTLPEDRLIVVGGCKDATSRAENNTTNKVEILYHK